ncbi:CML12, partial [Symbiodinium natans]
MTYDCEAAVAKIFETFDKEGSGYLAAERLGDALRLAGTNPTHAEVSHLLERLGHPSAFDAAALRQVMEEAVSEWLSKDQASELLSSFRLFDPAGCGRLSKQELLRIMQMGGYSFGEKEMEEMLQHVTMDSQGTVDYAELVSNYFLAPESGVAATFQARPRAKSDYPLARFRRAVRKLRMLRMVAFTTHSSSFTAENAVGVVEANLAIDEEFEQ